MVGEAQNSFPAEHGHRIAQKRDGGGGRDRGGQKKAALLSSPPLPPSMRHVLLLSACREGGRVNMSANDNIFQKAKRRRCGKSPSFSLSADMRTTTLEAGSDDEGNWSTLFFSHVFSKIRRCGS